jgi:hypothetical protein
LRHQHLNKTSMYELCHCYKKNERKGKRQGIYNNPVITMVKSNRIFSIKSEFLWSSHIIRSTENWAIHFNGKSCIYMNMYHPNQLHRAESSCEAKGHSDNQEIPCLLWNPKIHYQFHESLPLLLALS